MSRAREVVSAATLVEAVERGMNRRAMWLARGAESYARWGMQPSWTLVVEFTAARIEWEQLRLRGMARARGSGVPDLNLEDEGPGTRRAALSRTVGP